MTYTTFFWISGFWLFCCHPKLCYPKHLPDCASSSSRVPRRRACCYLKLLTARQLSVQCACAQPKFLPAPKSYTSANEVMNRLCTLHPHSVTVTVKNIETCLKNPASPVPKPFSLIEPVRARVRGWALNLECKLIQTKQFVWIFIYSDSAYAILCNTLVSCWQSVVDSSILSGGTSDSMLFAQRYQTGPGHKLAELHYFRQDVCGGARNMVKAESSSETM